MPNLVHSAVIVRFGLVTYQCIRVSSLGKREKGEEATNAMPSVGDRVYPRGVAGLGPNPEDRREAIPSVVEGLGGTIHGAWLTFGEYDTVLILELLDNVAGVATSIAFASGTP